MSQHVLLGDPEYVYGFVIREIKDLGLIQVVSRFDIGRKIGKLLGSGLLEPLAELALALEPRLERMNCNPARGWPLASRSMGRERCQRATAARPALRQPFERPQIYICGAFAFVFLIFFWCPRVPRRERGARLEREEGRSSPRVRFRPKARYKGESTRRGKCSHTHFVLFRCFVYFHWVFCVDTHGNVRILKTHALRSMKT
ncbi:hypothetical protein Nepgr_016424 [Nepenthes gracilis]|uniref:Uncharacterized protein n=1 Tax=Nepenthes gracilis TaxID=150966 RepID=A0AAD3SMN4_NEPGR|nr:hypothetical protein Nepgr_016424 [Nepenthes gracilis]